MRNFNVLYALFAYIYLCTRQADDIVISTFFSPLFFSGGAYTNAQSICLYFFQYGTGKKAFLRFNDPFFSSLNLFFAVDDELKAGANKKISKINGWHTWKVFRRKSGVEIEKEERKT